VLEETQKQLDEKPKNISKPEISAIDALRKIEKERQRKLEKARKYHDKENLKTSDIIENLTKTKNFVNLGETGNQLSSNQNKVKDFNIVNPFIEKLKNQEETQIEAGNNVKAKYLQEPENPTGAWSIFDGKFKSEFSNRIIPDIKLQTFEKFNKCTDFPQLPLNMVFRETTDLSDLTTMLESQSNILTNNTEGPVFNFLIGYVKASG